MEFAVQTNGPYRCMAEKCENTQNEVAKGPIIGILQRSHLQALAGTVELKPLCTKGRYVRVRDLDFGIVSFLLTKQVVSGKPCRVENRWIEISDDHYRRCSHLNLRSHRLPLNRVYSEARVADRGPV